MTKKCFWSFWTFLPLSLICWFRVYAVSRLIYGTHQLFGSCRLFFTDGDVLIDIAVVDSFPLGNSIEVLLHFLHVVGRSFWHFFYCSRKCSYFPNIKKQKAKKWMKLENYTHHGTIKIGNTCTWEVIRVCDSVKSYK